MSSSPGHLTRLSKVGSGSQISTPITDLNGTAAEKTTAIDQSTPVHLLDVAHDGCLACWWWTSEAVKFERKQISKIGARQSVRNRLLYTAHAVGSRASERCEQEVVDQKPTHAPRHHPYK